MAFLKRGIPTFIEQLEFCEKCKKIKDSCICTKKDQKHVHKKSNDNRRILYRSKSN